MNRRRRLLPAAVATALGVGLFLAGGLGLAPQRGGAPAPERPPGQDTADTGLAGDIRGLQEHLRSTPDDALAMASLGLAYVQQAKITADPSYYPKAEDVLTRSLSTDPDGNFTAMAGMAALTGARHDFTAALDWSQRAIAINPDNSTLYGTLADACTQLGRYPESFDAAQRMVDLKPGTPSLARASYTWELRGDTAAATALMKRALDDANTAADRAFALYHLSLLALGSGDPAGALAQAETGLRAAPGTASLLEARGRAEAALGRSDEAVTDLRRATAQVPQPEYVLELGELLQSLGRTAEAEEQYRVLRAEWKLFTGNGVTLDADAALFEADHGDPATAVAIAEQGLRTRPFLDTHDAYAWALHAVGRDAEALRESDEALALGTRNALFHYHRAVILRALGRNDEARTEFGTALATDPAFHPLHAPAARAALAELPPGS
ncbi:tetratricopeptide (TPR) repeat protein [Kitasatospora sp. SolWspMP-SS2h]|uniref:tetratricopeptide repeat protein n=1 Tax=Kitasatospora sp. SolWspMP-SS2h TaxID=1305729 RepID=UPI000DBAA5D0|nr:tetratricopeptide repeat protein [Kitasatospora sp. SolWspMP-SS2h]RAJ38435.1 tetratricopeptide (TPR) repeat protein [Kitasatospora sp. SolWspMP-SS2h]